MKVIPAYLPQFHTIPENDEWWGKGFTEWVNVKNAKPLFEGHNQPRVPLNNNYYDLSDIETLKWQCKLAKDYGIYGFCMYHYWFNGHLLLEKPMEMLLAHPEIDIKYCISWANHDWSDAWKATNRRPKILISHDFNDEQDWVNHFNYMLPFFKDLRYISENNKPFMVIYVPNLIPKLNKMLDLWTKMAKDAGFDGLTYIYQAAMSCFDKNWDRSKFDYGVEFQPGYVRELRNASRINKMWLITKHVKPLLKIVHCLKDKLFASSKDLRKWDYDKAWEQILDLRPSNKKTIPSAFVDWDNTPRMKERGTVYVGANPQTFKKYFKQLIINTRKYYQQDKIFVFAWNEWAEGGYLEPDDKYGNGYLLAIYESLNELNELE